jgi:hypothetical protein
LVVSQSNRLLNPLNKLLGKNTSLMIMTTVSKFSKFISIAAALATTTLAAVPKSQAATITVLDFEGINSPITTTDYAFINNFYNGGTSSAGTSGTNYGVTFSSNAQAICLNTLTESCSNTSRGGLGTPSSQRGGLFFLSGSQTFLNFASGFDTGFSFNYTAISNPGSINVYDGNNGTGNLLTTLALPTTSSSCIGGYSAGFCPFVASGVGFTGIAKSIGFAGVANQIVFDDITFGSVTPGNPGNTGTAVPEPFTIVGTMLGGAAALRMRKRLKVTNKL